MKKVLALAPHPDDIEIGCGGTLAEHVRRGDEVHVFVATCGEIGGEPEVRKQEQEASSNILGIHQLYWGGFQDTRLPEVGQPLMLALESMIQQVAPDVVYVNHKDDTHQDHRAMAQVALSVTRYVPNVLAYETPSSVDFDPKLYMDIQDTLDIKLEALKAHASQVDRTHVRLSIIDIALATAHFRGVQGRLASAEGFMPVRMRL